MFVVISRFAVANGMEDQVSAAFSSRPHLVDDAPGFVQMSVVRPADDPREFWLMTYWNDKESYTTWHRSHKYHESHAGIPKGLKLLPGRQRIDFFEHVAS